MNNSENSEYTDQIEKILMSEFDQYIDQPRMAIKQKITDALTHLLDKTKSFKLQVKSDSNDPTKMLVDFEFPAHLSGMTFLHFPETITGMTLEQAIKAGVADEISNHPFEKDAGYWFAFNKDENGALCNPQSVVMSLKYSINEETKETKEIKQIGQMKWELKPLDEL